MGTRIQRREDYLRLSRDSPLDFLPPANVVFILRPATVADVEWLCAVRRTTMRQYVEDTFGAWDDDAQCERFRQADERANIRIIMVERLDAGLLHVVHEVNSVFLANIQLLPAFQNRGVGAAVVRQVMAEGQAVQHPVRLQVLKVNRDARRLYERLGFVRTDETDWHTRMIWRPK
jgi:ribosomal protein S18 acetylase RimI-like enzyme